MKEDSFINFGVWSVESWCLSLPAKSTTVNVLVGVFGVDVGADWGALDLDLPSLIELFFDVVSFNRIIFTTQWERLDASFFFVVLVFLPFNAFLINRRN